MRDVWLYSLGTALGGERIASQRLVDEFGPVRDGFLDRTGFSGLYRSLPEETGLTLATDAINQSESDWWKPLVDVVIYVTSTGELVAPGNSHLLQSQLGLNPQSLLLDLNDACTGFIRAMHVTNSLLSSGAASTVLLVLSDTYSKLYEPSQLKLSPLFSDGASAMLISGVRMDAAPAALEPRRWRIESTWFLSEGGRAADLSIARDGEGSALGSLSMNGAGVFNFVLKHLPACLQSLTTSARVGLPDVTQWFVHQGSRAVVSAVEKTLGAVPGELFRARDYGNVVGSSLPFQIEVDKSKNVDQIIGLLAFGVGLTMAGMLVRQIAD